jgi:hypothetical protein
MTQYTPEEMNIIAEAPMMASLAVSMADLGLVSTAIEAAAMSKEIVGAGKKYPTNSIIQSVFSEETIKSGTIKLEKPNVTPEEVKSGALVERAIAAVNAAVGVISSKATPEEVAQFKEFVYSCADAVANAAGSGLFGSGANKVSPEEAVALTKLKATLGI